jgi:hypothetical protein
MTAALVDLNVFERDPTQLASFVGLLFEIITRINQSEDRVLRAAVLPDLLSLSPCRSVPEHRPIARRASA